jgi:uncharacterized lipoprotein YehR (DUF1307 family)
MGSIAANNPITVTIMNYCQISTHRITMKNIIKFIVLLTLVLSFNISGCEQEDLAFNIDCDNCLETIPDSADLIINVTINDENPFVPLTFYVGDYEDGIIDFIDTTRTEKRFHFSEVGTEYSVKATYQKDGETVIAIDGDKLRVVDGSGDCYPPCYFIRGGTLDVRLK